MEKKVNIYVVKEGNPLAGLLSLIFGLAEGAGFGLDTSKQHPKQKAEVLKEALAKDPDYFLKPDVKKVLVATVPSNHTSGKSYSITIDKEGSLYCNCKGFEYRGHCSHIDALLADGYGKPCVLFGKALCVNCDKFRREGIYQGRSSCMSNTVLLCPPRSSCDSFKRWKPVFEKEKVPMTFPIEGEMLQRFESKNHPGTFYEVKKFRGNLGCTCTGFHFHGSCKHVQYVRNYIMRSPICI
jgi:hypothetical protein